MRIASVILLAILICCTGLACSTSVTAPNAQHKIAEDRTLNPSHQLWGIYQFRCDPAAGTVYIAPLRGLEMHLNALHFLEPPPLVNITLESKPVFSGGNLDVDIGLRHPFLGLDQFTGFDVCGILITNGSTTGYSNPAIVYAGEDETYLINADGLTRWWNPTEFPYNPGAPIQGYIDGALGTPDAVADYSSTINGYKYFADGLGPNDDLAILDPTARGVFSAGTKNIRHYSIHLGGGLVFNYAVDACWAMPVGPPPIVVPDDFPSAANKPEAWRIDASNYDNTLYYEESTGTGGGNLHLEIDVYDHFNAGENTIKVESLAGLGPVSTSNTIGSGVGFSTYELDIPGDNLKQNGWIEVLIEVQSDVNGYNGKLPGTPVSAYFLESFHVQESSPHDYDLVFPDPPFQISDSSWFGCDNEWPRAIEDGSGQIIVAWQQNPPDTAGVRPVDRRSLDNGKNWLTMDSSISSGGELKQTKMALDSNGTAYQACLHYDGSGNPVGTSYLVRCPPTGDGYWGWEQGQSKKSLELIFTQDGYPLYFTDDGGKISFKKGLVQNSCYGEPGKNTWYYLPFQVAVPAPALLSYGTSIVRDSSGVIHLAYWDSTDMGKVWVVTNYDGTGLTWSAPYLIAQGGGGVITVYDPAMAYDDNGGLHMVYINEFSEVAPMNRIFYLYSSDGSPYDLTEAVVALGSFFYMDFPSVDAAMLPIGLAPVVAAGTGDKVGTPKDVFCAWQDPISKEWSENIQVNNPGVIAKAPSMFIDSQLYVHVVWMEVNADTSNSQIMYRRGEFATIN